MAPLSSRAAPRHLVSTRRAPPSSPPRLVRVRNPQRLLPRTDAGAAARCGVRRRPAPAADPPGCVGGVRRWRPRFPLTGSGCKFLYRETKRKAGPQPSPPGPISGNLCVRLAATQEGSSETRKLGIWNLGVPLLCLGPKRQEGASETRKLGIWNLGAVPWARTQEGASETRKLGIWNMPRSILESAHSESWNLEFAEEYPGICP
jgi:hypothetical protein